MKAKSRPIPDHALRGVGCHIDPLFARVSDRFNVIPASRKVTLGLRLVRRCS